MARGFTGARKALTGDLTGAALELSPSAVRNAAKGIVHPHHHPGFDFDEDALMHGVQLFANAPFALNRLAA